MGLYSFFENKYYDAIEAIDKIIPITKLTDKIDKKVPSFIVFLLLLVVIIVFFLVIFIAPQQGQYNAKIKVTDSAGSPINEAIISVQLACGEENLSLPTNQNGEAEFNTCTGTVQLIVSKEKYLPYSEGLDLEKTNSYTIVLQAEPQKEDKYTIKVTDSQKTIIREAVLSATCFNSSSSKKIDVNAKKQAPDGFSFKAQSNCDSLQLKASAEGYKDKTYSMEKEERQALIVLEKEILEGTILFTAATPAGAQSEATITIIDYLENEETKQTTISGQAIFERKKPGNYTYVAVLQGSEPKEGSFVLKANETLEVNVLFKAQDQRIGTEKYIYFKTLDGSNPVNADARIYYTQNTANSRDMNYLMPIQGNTLGIFGPRQITDSNKKYFGVIKSIGYKTKLAELETKLESEKPQEVQMQQGGAKLKLKIIDDESAPIENASASIYYAPFKGVFDKALPTDKNGLTQFMGLPDGTYTVTASTENETSTMEGIIISGADKELIIMLVTGKATLNFNFYAGNAKTNPGAEVFTKVSGAEFVSAAKGPAKKGVFTLMDVKPRAQAKLIINDENHFPFQSLVYTTKRGAQTRQVYLRQKEELPNNNAVQLILRQAYQSNPVLGEEKEATQLIQGKNYYLLFDAIINTQTTAKFTANFFISPKDKNTLQKEDPLRINSAQSISESSALLSRIMRGHAIDPSKEGITDSDAKQLNLVIQNASGKLMFPILVELKVDENAKGKAALFWSAEFGSEKSLDYSKEFEIGKTFCIGEDCPSILFTNYLKKNTKEELIAEAEIKNLLVGDSYSIKTIAENNTDKDLGDANLEMQIEPAGTNYLSFPNDKNYLSQEIKLKPLSAALPKEFNLVPKQAMIGAIKIHESVRPVNQSVKTQKAEEPLRFSVKNKDQLQIAIIASDKINTLYEKSIYPQVLIKTMYSTKKVVSAQWKIFAEGKEQTPIKTGITDQNGIQLTGIDLSNITRGTKIILTAEDDNGALPARTEIIVSTMLEEEPVPIPECVHIKIGAKDIREMNEAIISTQINTVQNFSVKSECTEKRKITIDSELEVSPKTFDLMPAAEQQVTINSAPAVALREGMLGDYPLRILSATNETSSQAGLIDVIINDPNSCFELDKVIYDLRATDKIAGKITNKCFSGRKDNFYPKADISTNSVTISYKKPGNPEYIDMNATVIGSAIEAFFTGGAWSTVHKFGARGCDNTWFSLGNGTEASEYRHVYFFDDYASKFRYDGTIYSKPEPELEITDPSKPLGRMYTLNDIPQETLNTEPIKSRTPGSASSPNTNKPAELEKAKEINSSAFPATIIASSLNMHGSMEFGSAQLPQYYIDHNDKINTHYLFPEKHGTDSQCEFYKHNTIGYYWGPNSSATEDEAMNMCNVGGTGRFTPELSSPIFYAAKKSGDSGAIWGGLDLSTPERWYSSTYPWRGHRDGGVNRYTITMVAGCQGDGRWCAFENGGYLGGGKLYEQLTVAGSITNKFGGHDKHSSMVNVQNEKMRYFGEFIEKRAVWQRPVRLKTTEGVIQTLGHYSAQPVPEWLGVTKWGKTQMEIGDQQNGNTCSFKVIDIYPAGLIPPEYMLELNGAELNYYKSNCIATPKMDSPCEKKMSQETKKAARGTKDGEGLETPYITRPAADPLVEYSSEGTVMYYIPQDTIPGWTSGNPLARMFIKDGTVYAEYIGKPEIASPNIDFNITKINLLGQEYAVLTVSDWVNGEKKETKKFQIKLKGNPTNCYSSEGTAGVTGKEFIPRIMLNWDWNNITVNQCDYGNPDYVYCDAAQFNIELFKKIRILNEYEMIGKIQEIPKYMSFYAYLIKDNYAPEFLQDFYEYYNTKPFSSAQFFNSTQNYKGYDQLITIPNAKGEKRIKFNQRTDEDKIIPETRLQKPGLYRVEIKIIKDNENLNSYFGNNSPNASFEITLKFLQEPKNNNPFYETPFDGEIGKNNSVFERKNYGASISGTALKLTPSISAQSYNNSLIQINNVSFPQEGILDNETTLSYSLNSKRFRFNPSTPTPVIAKITNTGLGTEMSYKLIGMSAPYNYLGKWQMIDSTLGRGKCTDFFGNQDLIYTEKQAAAGAKKIEWKGDKKGTITISKIFFTPTNTPQFITLNSLSDPAKAIFTSYPNITSPSSIQLNNYLNSEDNDSLQSIFDAVSSQKMCISQNSSQTIQTWWNKDYLDKLIKEIAGANTKTEC